MVDFYNDPSTDNYYDSPAPLPLKRRALVDPAAPDLGTGVPSGASLSPALSPNRQPTFEGTQEFQNYEDVGNRLRQALQPNPVSMPRALLGAFVSRRNPMLGSVITGDFQRQRQIQPLEQQLGLLGNIITQNRAMQLANANLQKTGAETGKAQAEAGKAQAETAAIPTKTALEQAQTEAANYKDDPNLGLIDLRTKQPVSTQGFAPLTAQEAQVLGKQPGDSVPLKVKNTASEIANRGIATVNTEEGVFERNRQNGSMTRLGSNPRAMFAPDNRIIPVSADPNDPGNLTYMRAGQALQTGAQAPGSATVGAAKAMEKSATSGKIGEEVNAFNTAMQHADLLKQAATAMNNGDERTLNTLKNKISTELGSPDVTNFQAIANAYSREVTKMLSSGHMTDAEIGSSSATLPANASPRQIIGAIDNYKALAASKMKMRQQQVEQGLKGKANFPTTGGAQYTRPSANVVVEQ